jgi:hypothetical protein
MTLNTNDTERPVGSVPMQVGGAPTIGQQKAKAKNKRKKSKRRR